MGTLTVELELDLPAAVLQDIPFAFLKNVGLSKLTSNQLNQSQTLF